MKRLNNIFLTVLVMLAAGCSESELPQPEASESDTATVSISLGITATADESGLTRSDDSAAIAALWYAIADSNGNIFSPRLQHLDKDFSKLTIEGLKEGDYTLVFLASDTPAPNSTVSEPAALKDIWLSFDPKNMPLGEEWFYKKLELHVTPQQHPVHQTVTLDRCTGRIDVDFGFASDYAERFIRRIEIAVDQTDGFFKSLSADGLYASHITPGVMDITATRSLLTPPSSKPLSGRIIVTAERSDGSEYERSYKFSGLEVKSGHISHIRVEFDHPEDNEGIIYVREEDFERFRTDTMLLASEPRSVFYDNSKRWFRVNNPLQASIDNNHRLQIRFYSPVPVANVTIRCRFNKVSTEFFDLAHFDTVYPFMEGAFEIPVTSAPKVYTSADGRKVIVPQQSDLSDDDVTLEVVCDDPFMKKIAAIDSHWLINFSAFAADSDHPYWRHMTPELCRHGVALALNMAYMFASEEFNTALNAYDGKLLDDHGGRIDLDELRIMIRRHAGLTLGLVTGVGGLGGGTTYGLADYCYHEVYWDWEANALNEPHTYVRQAMFHEYGHCLGYGHDSTMTYGDQWTVLCATVFVTLGSQDKLPVSSKNIIANLPM